MNKLILTGIVATILLTGCINSVKYQYLPVLNNAEQLIETNPDSAYLLLKTIEHPEELSEHDFAKWCMISGKIFNHRTDHGKMYLPSLFFEKANRFYKQYGTTEQQAFIRLYLGYSYQKAGEYDQAMQIYTEILKDAKEWKEYNVAGMVCSYMGDLYLLQFLSPKSREKYKEAIHYFDLGGNQRTKATILVDLGFDYLSDEQAIEGLKYIQQADSIAHMIQDSSLIRYIYYYSGLAYNELNNFSAAEQNLSKALQFTQTKTDLVITYYALNSVYITSGDFQRARKALELGMNTQTKYGVFYQLYLIEKNEQNFIQALNYLEQYQDALDSIQTEQKKMHTFEIEQKYNLEHAENVKNKAQISAQRNYIVALIATTLAFLVLLIHQVLLRRKNRIISQQQASIKSSDQVIAKISDQLAQEKEAQQELEKALEKSNKEHEKAIIEHQQRIRQLKKDSFHVKQERLKYLSDIGKKIMRITEKVKPGGKEFSTADWQALKVTLLEAYPTLNGLIFERSTALTDTEIRQSMLTFFNLGAKGEAIIMNVMPDSVYKQRTRLRQKLFLEEGAGLFEFFKTYCIEHE